MQTDDKNHLSEDLFSFHDTESYKTIHGVENNDSLVKKRFGTHILSTVEETA